MSLTRAQKKFLGEVASGRPHRFLHTPPLVPVVEWFAKREGWGNMRWDRLACGHWLHATSRWHPARKRRCKECHKANLAAQLTLF